MTKCDKLIKEIRDCMYSDPIDKFKLGELIARSVVVIEHLQAVIRHYNPDDSILDDEKNKVG